MSNSEHILIQVNLSGNWNTRYTLSATSSDKQISQKIEQAHRGAKSNRQFTGRVRAIGETSKRIFDSK